MMIDRRILANIDWTILIVVLALISVGIINLYSATSPVINSNTIPLFLRQTYWALIGLILIVIIIFIDYHLLERFAYPIYWFSITLLLLVLFIGREASGSQRWLQIASFSFQPSELAKLAVIIALAKYFHKDQIPDGYLLKDLIPPVLITALPIILIIKEPDLGTSAMFALIAFTLFLFLKIRSISLSILAATILVASPFLWRCLAEYQKRRIITFFNPSLDPLGDGYHITQSKIAVGSGGFWGKGFLEGTQNQLRFLPEQHTDFVFSVFAEEWGFLGSSILLIILFFLIIKGFDIAMQSRDKLGILLAFGIVTMFFWHIIINIGMVIGILPVVGAPLPFISYGGSALVINMAAVGILLNIHMRRFIF